MQERLVAARDSLGTGKVERRSPIYSHKFQAVVLRWPHRDRAWCAVDLAADFDRKLRASDAKTGKLLWQGDLRLAGNATVSTYVIEGKLYIVIAASGS
jgi:hypothetical protein